MATYIEAPRHNPNGPDGQGWNRTAIHPVLLSGQCKLQPTSYETLFEAMTGRERWGGFNSCDHPEACGSCSIFNRKPYEIRAFTDRVLVRIDERNRCYLMNKPEDGWASFAYPIRWNDLARITGWNLGERFRDDESEGFWLERE